jgi:hypothetical protein
MHAEHAGNSARLLCYGPRVCALLFRSRSCPDRSFISLSSACSACIALLHLLRKSRRTDVRLTVMAGHVPAIRSESLQRQVAGTCPAMTVHRMLLAFSIMVIEPISVTALKFLLCDAADKRLPAYRPADDAADAGSIATKGSGPIASPECLPLRHTCLLGGGTDIPLASWLEMVRPARCNRSKSPCRGQLRLATTRPKERVAEHSSLRCPAKPGAAYCGHDRYSDPRCNRCIPGA